MLKIDGIVFDMDGVIFDTERLGLEAWDVVGERHGFENIRETALLCIGRSTKDTKEIIKQRYGVEDIEPLHREVNGVFKEIIDRNGGLPVKKGARRLLSLLKDRGVTVGLASSTRKDIVRAELDGAGLLGYFRETVGGDMVENSKPQPDIYLLACDKLGIAPERSLAIEDSHNGIISASAAKMLPVLVPDMIEPDERMLSLSYLKFDDLDELADYLERELPE